MVRKPIKGSVIDVEGGDGSGKGTQVKFLSDRLVSLGYNVAIFDFPRYGEFYGKEVGRLMRGAYGPLDKVDPFLAALLYAGDRLEALPEIKYDLESGAVVLCNRFVSSNLAHGAAKYQDMASAIKFIAKVEYMEYGINRLPVPDLQLFLDVPPEGARRMLASKGEREYMGGRGIDLAEADLSHQEKARMMYQWLCENREGFVRVDCGLETEGIKSRKEVEALIWGEVNKKFIL